MSEWTGVCGLSEHREMSLRDSSSANVESGQGNTREVAWSEDSCLLGDQLQGLQGRPQAPSPGFYRGPGS